MSITMTRLRCAACKGALVTVRGGVQGTLAHLQFVCDTCGMVLSSTVHTRTKPTDLPPRVPGVDFGKLEAAD